MKIIEIHQEHLIVCDNPRCDYKIKNETGDPNAETKHFIGVPCPKCGQNLLTQQDYDDAKKLLSTINFVNRWFGWLSLLVPNKKRWNAKSVHIHKGYKIEDVKTNEKSKDYRRTA